MKKYYLLLIILGLIFLTFNILVSAKNSEIVLSDSDKPYYCYDDSGYHCNSYKEIGDYCVKYCIEKISNSRYQGNRANQAYNCMTKCYYGKDSIKLFYKRYNGRGGIGLNYKFS